MSVLIKGMEMPTTCVECPMICEEDLCHITKDKTTINERAPHCPLIELPPHGALIDMDDFLSEWSELESYRTAMRLCEVIPAKEGET